MKPEERLTLLFLSREATVLEVFASSWQLLQRPVCLASSLLAVGGYGQEARLAGVHCGRMERSCTPPLQQWLWLSSGASWLYCILLVAGIAASLVAWFWVVALGAISGNSDLNLSFQTSNFFWQVIS